MKTRTGTKIDDKIETKTIKQNVLFKAEPHEVYEALMDEKKHSKFTKARAHIEKKVGGKFYTYDKYIIGTNLDLIEDKKIVQSWHGSDWPQGHYSKATFLLKKTKEGTKLTFTQTGVPKERYADIKEGWEEHYWAPMKEMLGA